MRQLLRPFITLIMVMTALLLAQAVAALEVMPLKGRVNDYAGILAPATATQLEHALKSFETDQSTQLAVLTIPSLEGESLEAYSLKVAETWKIGQQVLDNGAILLIAQNDRKLRIEVGYGLEGSLTDLVCGRIIRNVIVPRFKEGNFDQGVIDGVNAMMAAVKGEFSAADAPRRATGNQDYQGFFIMLACILLFIGKAVGDQKPIAATVGGFAAPLLGKMILAPGWLLLLALVPIGAVGAFIASALTGRPRSLKGRGRSSRYYPGGGGFGSSSGGFGGGFSGGGGGFGGGGASGGW